MSHPRCQLKRRDGSVCNGSLPKRPDGELNELCAGHRRLERRRVLAEEIAARVGSVDLAEVMYAVAVAEFAAISTDALALALCEVSR